MKNIRNQLITIPGDIIELYWPTYKLRCLGVESALISKPSDSCFSSRIHITGAFKLSTKASKLNSKLFNTFITGSTNLFTIKRGDYFLLRGLNYFPDILPISAMAKLEIVESNLLKLYKLVTRIDLQREDITIYLAALDYIKNYLLIVLHILHLLQRRNSAIIEEISENIYKEYCLLIENVEEDFIRTWYSKCPSRSKIGSEIPSIISKVLHSVKKVVNHYSNSELDSLDLFRSYRENNHPIKLMQFGEKISREYLHNTLLIGIEYGGLELPFLINGFRSYKGKDKLETLIINVSNYSEKRTSNIEAIFDIIPMFIRKPNLDRYSKALLLDDSITTGRTVSVINSILPRHITDLRLATVSVTLSNRYHHITRSDHGGLNPYVLESMFSLYRSTYTATYSKATYTNKSGIFNKERNQIKRLLRESYFNNILKNG